MMKKTIVLLTGVFILAGCATHSDLDEHELKITMLEDKVAALESEQSTLDREQSMMKSDGLKMHRDMEMMKNEMKHDMYGK